MRKLQEFLRKSFGNEVDAGLPKPGKRGSYKKQSVAA